MHLNLVSLYASLFGSVRMKVLYDTFRKAHYAYGIFEAAHRAKNIGLKGITVIEFGVASGRGLIAMIMYSEKIAKYFGIEIKVIGFDSGEGMPPVVDFRDHPELYTHGDFPMINRDKLMGFLGTNAKLEILNLINETWIDKGIEYPVGFLSVDVDYYSSTSSILKQLVAIDSNLLLPNTLIYFDDVILDNHNAFQGELLSISEFNEYSPVRKIDFFGRILRHQRMLKHEHWIDNMYQLHVLDHKLRKEPYRGENSSATIIPNKYIR